MLTRLNTQYIINNVVKHPSGRGGMADALG